MELQIHFPEDFPAEQQRLCINLFWGCLTVTRTIIDAVYEFNRNIKDIKELSGWFLSVVPLSTGLPRFEMKKGK